MEPKFSDNCPEDPFEVSDAQTMLDYLKENK
jgi:peroxiredoxin